jgi:hypothetical protein
LPVVCLGIEDSIAEVCHREVVEELLTEHVMDDEIIRDIRVGRLSGQVPPARGFESIGFRRPSSLPIVYSGARPETFAF